MEQAIKAIIFDMDGVLIDSEALHACAKRSAFRLVGIDVSESEIQEFVGQSDKAMVDAIAARHDLSSDQHDRILKEKMRIYEENEPSLEEVPGATCFVRWASDHFRLAVATSATPRNRRSALHALGIAGFFEVTVDSSDVAHPKPWPDLYEAASTRLGLDGSQCLVVEDAIAGIVSARSAGCLVAALCGTFTMDKLLNAGADFIFQDYQSLRTFLDRKQ
jgi:beta-phosphoglucomutase-like phosphatase (HAD superfamily)